jgi:uncharacterized protein YbjQ (UPF0145 family)
VRGNLRGDIRTLHHAPPMVSPARSPPKAAKRLRERRGRDSNPRTTKPPLTVFETAAFNHSATPPGVLPSIERLPRGGSACRAAGYRQPMDDILIVTTNEVPGYEITQVHGEVCGLIVRARNAFSNMGAGLRTVFGGEARGYTTLLLDSRNEALERLREAAREKGANAVVAMRFDCNEIASIMSEVAAYGTAVTIARR